MAQATGMANAAPTPAPSAMVGAKSKPEAHMNMAPAPANRVPSNRQKNRKSRIILTFADCSHYHPDNRMRA